MQNIKDRAVRRSGAATENRGKALLVVIVSVFFFWGFAASGNALLIPVFKESFKLSQFQAQLVELAFYIAYFSGSVLYFIISLYKSSWLPQMTSKKGMINGLIISAAGSLLLVVATFFHSYLFFLCSLFIIAFGFTLQQIVANPLLVLLGNPNTGAHRLILAGSINSFGSTIAPLVLSVFLFGGITTAGDSGLSLPAVRFPYLVLAGLYLLFAFWFYRTPVPATHEEGMEPVRDLGALKYPQLLWGMLAIFCYVGGEVTMQSNLPALIQNEKILGLSAKDAVHYLSLFGGSLMIGRWTGAVFNIKLPKGKETLLLIVMPFLAFIVVLFVNGLKGSPLSEILDYALFLPVLIAALLLSGKDPVNILIYAGFAAVIMLTASLVLTGKYALYCVIAAALFSALMWPCIFPLAIKGLGKYTQQGSSLLIMMILGGAIIPPLQGWLADQPAIAIQASYFLPLICFAYVAWYGVRCKEREVRSKK
jgi:FHS family L-fucose permease-like MFS transporter